MSTAPSEAIDVGRLAIVGCGVMGRCILQGLLAAGWRPADIVVAEKEESERSAIAERFGVRVTPRADQAADGAGIAIIAVQPHNVLDVLRADPWPADGPQLVISVCAGAPLSLLERHLPATPVIRAMPNIPVKVGAGTIVIAGSSRASEADFVRAERVFAGLGVVIRLPEVFFDAVTALSGSGPAYLFLLAESMIEAGVSCGLPRDAADVLTRQTLVGASRMLGDSADSPASLRRAVTSPAGTTAAALKVFEASRFRSTVFEAIHAADARSQELSQTAAVP